MDDLVCQKLYLILRCTMVIPPILFYTEKQNIGLKEVVLITAHDCSMSICEADGSEYPYNLQAMQSMSGMKMNQLHVEVISIDRLFRGESFLCQESRRLVLGKDNSTVK